VAEQGGGGRPIGYWLKRADEAITARADKALAGVGLTRQEWQALNVIRAAGTSPLRHLAQELRSFADEATLEASVGRLVDRGWVSRRSESDAVVLALTDAGAKAYEQALSVQTTVRQQLMRGIAPEEYQMVVRILQTIVENLEG
jgi:DNA-binding MarR family transcriptional regulator